MILDVQHTCSSRSALRNRAFFASSYFASVLLALAHSSRKLVFFADAYVSVLVGVWRRRRVPDSAFGSRSHLTSQGPTIESI